MWRNPAKMTVVLLLALLMTVGSYAVGLARDRERREPLIELLIRKGIITEKEAGELEKEAGEVEKRRQQEIVEEIEEKELAVPKALEGIKVGALWYLDYSNGKEPASGDKESSFNRFKITRGYLTVKKEIFPWFRARITMDTHQDREEDWKVRLKYLYAELRPPDVGPLTGMKSEFGLGHIPWLDFEEHVNPYRCQGTMAIERAGVFNSADLGLSLRGAIGGRLANAEEKVGHHHYDGRWGTWHLGVFNGAGYHAKEKNNNKVFDGRLTLRPLPDRLPGLQLSYFGLIGEGNIKHNGPDYVVNLGMLSYEHPWGIFTAQYFATKGNNKGSWVDAAGNELDTEGYSFFGKVRLPIFERRLSLFGRYDHFDQDKDGQIGTDAEYDMYLGGLACQIYKGNLVLLAFETTDYGRDAGKKGAVPVKGNNLGDDYKVQAVLQLKF